MAYVLPDIQGWMGDAEMAWLYERASEMTSIVEVGSWKGRSTHAILSGCPGPVFAVDHFKGNPNELDGAHKEATTTDIFLQFWQNVGKFRNLVPMRMESAAAARYFADKSVDMVFIDGDHTEAAFQVDINSWLPKCRKLICGHDESYNDIKHVLAVSNVVYEKAGGIWFKYV